MTIPRLRPELQATPADEEGVRFFDVRDPSSGHAMRLYDFEWQLASQLDGQRSLDDVAEWAKRALELDVTRASLAAYAARLAELGFLAGDAMETLPPRDPGALNASMTPLPPPSPGLAGNEEDIPLELADDALTERQEALPPRTLEPLPVRPASPGFDARDARPDEVTARAPVKEPSLTTRSGAGPMAHGDEDTPAPRRSRSVMGLLLVLILVGGVVAYVTFLSPGGAKVAVQVVRPRELVTLHDGSAKLEKGSPRSLSFGEAGKVTDVIAAGAEVKAGTPLATLDGFGKVEKELADVKDRLGFYQKQLDAATAKGDAAAQKAAEGKVAEKKKLLDELET